MTRASAMQHPASMTTPFLLLGYTSLKIVSNIYCGFDTARVFQCIVCLQYVLNSLGFCNTLEILGNGWSLVVIMILILIFETILRLAHPKSKNGVVVHMYNDTC